MNMKKNFTVPMMIRMIAVICVLSFGLVGCASKSSANEPISDSPELISKVLENTLQPEEATESPDITPEPTPDATSEPTQIPIELDFQQFKEAVSECDLDHSGLFAMKDNNLFGVWNTVNGDVYLTLSRADTGDCYIIHTPIDGDIFISDSAGNIYLFSETTAAALDMEIADAWLDSVNQIANTMDAINLYDKLANCLEVNFSEENVTLERLSDNDIQVLHKADNSDQYLYNINIENYHLSQCKVKQSDGVIFWANMDMFVVFPDEYTEDVTNELILSMTDCISHLIQVFQP